MKNWEEKISKAYDKMGECLGVGICVCGVLMFGGHIYRMIAECDFTFKQFIYLCAFFVIAFLAYILMRELKKYGKEN